MSWTDDRQLSTDSPAIIYPEPNKENNSFTYSISNPETNNVNATIDNYLDANLSTTSVEKKPLCKHNCKPMEIDFNPPTHPPNNVTKNNSPPKSEQKPQPMIIDRTPIITSHSSPRDNDHQLATDIN